MNYAFRSFFNASPMLIAVILLVGLVQKAVPESVIKSIFTENPVIDTLIGAVIGSISAGNPITSYIIGGELLDSGISLYAVTAFMVAWVTVGFIQLPAEMTALGKKFAVIRNIISFILSILIAIVTVLLLKVI